MDIIVTVPKKEYANVSKEDSFAKGKEAVQFWSVPKKPKNLNVGDRVYFVERGCIRYWHEFLGFDYDSVCEATDRVWAGLNLVIKYPETKLTNPIPMKGFQGFRYMKKRID